MRDYIQFPAILMNTTDLYSNTLSRFLKQVTITNNKCSLDQLRLLFKENREQFFKVVDELALRGFHFHTERQNNLLPYRKVSLNPFIKVSHNENRYQHINFSILGIASFTKRFNVDSDMFFHKMPLEGLKHLNASINIEEIKTEFERVGFTIINRDENQESTTAFLNKDYKQKTVAENEHHIESNLPNPFIDDLFSDGFFCSFRIFCSKHGITSVSQITRDTILTYHSLKGVGTGKINAINKKLQSIGINKPELFEDNVVNEENYKGIECKYAGRTAISVLFSDAKHILFREFCEQQQIETISDLKQEHISQFSFIPGVGKKKVENILETLEGYRVIAEQNSHFISGELYERIKELKVTNLFDFFNIDYLEEKQFTIADIEGKSLEELDSLFDGDKILQLSSELSRLKEPKQLAANVIKSLSKRDIEVLNKRLIADSTLQETADMYKITRERVRQIEKSALVKIFSALEQGNFNTIIKLLSSSNKLITKQDLTRLVGKENELLINILARDERLLTYVGVLNVFYFSDEGDNHQAFVNTLEKVMDELPDQFFLEEYIQSIEENLEKIGIYQAPVELIEDLLTHHGFNQYKDFYSRTKLRYSDLFQVIFKYNLDEAIRIDEQGAERIRQIAKTEYDYDIDSNVRSIHARIADTKDVLLVDRSTYQWFDSERFDKNIIDKIEAYLKKYFEDNSVINAEQLLNVFNKELQEHGVNTKYHLYSLLKYYLDDEFSIGHGNTLNIYSLEEKKQSREEMLVDTVKSLGGNCTKQEILDILQWPLYKLDLTISSTAKVVPWGTNKVKLLDSLQLTEDHIVELRELCMTALQKGYTTTGQIFKEMMFNRNLASLIGETGLKAGHLPALLKTIIPDLKGHTNFFYIEGSRFTCIDDVVIDTFTEDTSRSEIMEFIIDLGYKDLMASNITNRLLERGHYIEIDVDKLYATRDFSFDGSVVEQVLQFVESTMTEQNQVYLSLSKLSGYRRKLPVIDFRWNAHLIKSIVTKHGYRQVMKKYRDYRFDKVIIVKEECEINSFEELIYHILKHEYDGKMHQVFVYDYLVEKGILREQNYDYNKVLPHEIRSVDNLVNVDEIGIVTLK